MPAIIDSPDSPNLPELCAELAAMSEDLAKGERWPGRQLKRCGEYGVFRWFLEPRWGGWQWNAADICRGYLALSEACLTTTFVITQRMGAVQRIAGCDNAWLQERLLQDLVAGETFATVGISHLTTSRRHLARPPLHASLTGDEIILNGYSPWVTGAPWADYFVLGCTLDDGCEILAAVPRATPGVTVPTPHDLVGLTASQTGPVELDQVRLDRRWLISGPTENVLQQGTGGATGGIQTSTLALGLATAAIRYLEQQSDQRADFRPAARQLWVERESIVADLLEVGGGRPVCATETLRSRANQLVLRATQAALIAAKGAGYVAGHPVGRWCGEALFFLVWSCPQPVMFAHLCDLAGVAFED
jgi:alkylation response protein AidB-like acyl-CoA dehydrogenase